MRITAARGSLRTLSASAGLQYETYDGFEDEVKKFCDWFIPKVDEYEELLTNNRIWVGRLKGVGVLSAEECKEYGVTGPVLRAAGVKWDLRKALPYSGYDQYEFDIPTAENGDTYDRYTVRMEEMRQSTRILRQAIDRIPSGPIMGKVPKGGEAAGGRGICFDRSAQRRAGLLHRQRQFHATLSHASAAAIVWGTGRRSTAWCAAGWWRMWWRLLGTLDIVLGEVDR